MSSLHSFAWRVIRGIAMFWWDFLVGDTPELFVAVVFIVGTIALVSVVGHLRVLAIVLLPVLSVSALVLSVLRARGASKSR